MYLTKIKLSPITNLADARFAAAAGLDYIGFCFDPNDANFITPIKAKEIVEWTSGALTVAEFGDQPINEIVEITGLLNMDVVQLNNKLPANQLAHIDRPIIKVFSITEPDYALVENELKQYAPFTYAFLLQGTLEIKEHHDWFIKLCTQYKIIWAITVDPTHIKQIAEIFKPYAINITPGVEEKTGVKDFEALYDVLEELGVE
ncbi:MAG: hypothetical protein H7296_07360 [Bacteroidia bacterium]|nr:hypothetical protein [Bacteroidia bacterium]